MTSLAISASADVAQEQPVATGHDYMRVLMGSTSTSRAPALDTALSSEDTHGKRGAWDYMNVQWNRETPSASTAGRVASNFESQGSPNRASAQPQEATGHISTTPDESIVVQETTRLNKPESSPTQVIGSESMQARDDSMVPSTSAQESMLDRISEHEVSGPLSSGSVENTSLFPKDDFEPVEAATVDLSRVWAAKDKYEAASAWEQVFANIGSSPKMADAAQDSDAMAPPPKYTVVIAAKVWFACQREERELLTYIRADSRHEAPSYDGLGGVAERADRGDPKRTLLRELHEEVRLPAEWHAALQSVLRAFPLGQVKAQVAKHSTKELHHVYMWLVECQPKGGRAQFTTEGQREAKKNSLAFRSTAAVVKNTMARLPAYGKALQELVSLSEQADRSCAPAELAAAADRIWQPSKDSVALRAVAHEVQLGKGKDAASAPPNLKWSKWLAPSIGKALVANTPAPRAALAIIPIPKAKSTDLRDLALCVPEFNGPLFEREIRLPVDESYVWPKMERFAFYEDGGNLREAWAARGYTACSVADRPTQRAPSIGAYHFIGQVYEFVQTFPYSIDMHTSHVECGPASWSSWKTWPTKILEGRMREAGEELLWISSIGNRSMNEQPHTAHESTLGPPSQVINANDHGGFNKTWCLWKQNIGRIDPSNKVPEEEKSEILSQAKGDKEQKMLQRSRTEPQVAAALVAAMDAYKNVPVAEPDRPAAMPCSQYEEWRQAFHHNLGILSSYYAPVVSDELVDGEARNAIAFIMPLAPGASGPLFMVPLTDGSVFGIETSGGKGAKEEVESASAHLSIGIESHYMHGMGNSTKDIVVAIPWDAAPAVAVTTAAELSQAREDGAVAVWASISALEGTTAFLPAHFAAMRCAAMAGAVMADSTRPGIWTHARPAILSKRAAEYGAREGHAQAEQEWQAFLQAERGRALTMQADLLAADNGTGLVERFRANVRTAADYADELPVPAQGLPTFHAERSLFVSAPQRPPPLDRKWLHRLPPQQVPPGFVPLRYDQVLRGWARRMVATTYNKNIVYDGFCFEHGESPSHGMASHLRRPDSFTLGRGAAKEIRHADGLGSYNAFDLLLEAREDGLFHPVDFTKPEKRVWVFQVIEEYLGTVDNQEIMSFLFHGVCWKINMRGQLHVSRNLARYDERAQAVAKTVAKLAKASYVDIVPICTVEAGLSPEGPSPFIYIPQNHVPVGGIDKEDGTARLVGDMSDPHASDPQRRQLIRNKPEGEPDGPPAQSPNELSGPKGAPKQGYSGPLPFPEPEIKPRPRHKYAACVYLRIYADANGTFLVTMDDDMRQMFFQFFVREEDLYTVVWYIIFEIDGVLWLVAVRVRTMNMGGRNASKIACNFAEEWLDAWRRQMDAVVLVWLPKQTKELQDAYQRRKDELGFEQARPFWAAVYTDNFDFTFCASDLAAIGTTIWRQMNARAKIELQTDIIYGTCTSWIGGRYVLQGGFGCLPPSKRSRAMQECRAALEGRATREEYESNNSFLGHVADICGWPIGSLQGITGPLKVPGFDDDIVVLTPQAKERYENAIVLLESHSFASFEVGVVDAYELWRGRGDALVPIHNHASDCCTEPMPHEYNADPEPHVAGYCDGYFWRFKLTGEWRDRHITLTEGTGPALNALNTVPKFPDDINVLGNDATAAIAAGAGRARSANMQIMQRVLEKSITYKIHADTLWYDHWKGWANGITDLISRDNLRMARRLAAAFGIKLTELELTAESHAFMQEVLERTRETSQAPRAARQSVVVAPHIDDGAARSAVRATYAGGQPPAAANHESADIQQTGQDRKCLRDRGGGLTDVESPPGQIVTLDAKQPQEVELLEELMSPAPLMTRDEVKPSPLGEVERPPSPVMLASRPAPSPIDEACAVANRHSPRVSSKMLKEVSSVARASDAQRCGSPQPMTAADAILQANDQVARRLAGSTSVYAICPSEPNKLRGLIREACHYRQRAIPKGSKGANEWGFKKVVAFCKHMGGTVRWMRPRLSEPFIDVEEEVWFTALALLCISQTMSPSARRAKRGYGEAQPTSALLAIYGWHRVLHMCGRYTCDLTTVKQVLMGLCQRYKNIWGQEAFVKEQAKIFSKQMLLDVVQVLSDKSVPNWSEAQHDCWNVQFKYLTATGTRNDEFSQDGDEDDCLMRENMTLVDQKTYEAIEVTEAELRKVRNGHLLRGTSASSKCDRLNVEWSKQHQWFRYDDTEPLCFAVAWVEWELKYPCKTSERRKWPAFSPTGNAKPATSDQVSAQHKVLITHALGETKANGRTVHSHRARLASALAAARASGKHPELSDAIIQMHLRWKTLASLLSYMKATPHSFANNVALGVATDAGEAIREDSPVVEPTEVVNEIIATIGVLSDSASNNKRKQVDAEESTHEAPGAANEKGKKSADAGTEFPKVAVVGAAHPVQTMGKDSWGLVGSDIDIPDELWHIEGNTTTECTVTYFLGKYKFPLGGSHLAYTITPTCEQNANYAVKAEYLRDRLSATKRKELRKTKLLAAH